MATARGQLSSRTVVRVLLGLTAFLQSTLAFCHGVPIDVVAVNGKLTPFLVDSLPAEIASLQLDSKSGLVSATSPGFGVTNNANRIVPGTSLGLDIVSMLGYWDGSSLRKTDAALKINSPEGSDYLVRSNSGDQRGMQLGVFQGFPFWEADSVYTLVPSSSEIGLYGFMAQVTSPTYEDSEPFLFPLVYDPEITLGPAGFRKGVSALRDLFGTQSFDANEDGVLDGQDVNEICSAIRTDEGRFDYNGDGELDIADVDKWLEANFTTNADANLDGVVDFVDFLILSSDYPSEDSESSWTQGDFTCDGNINFTDFLVLTSNFSVPERRSSNADSVRSVPEPAPSLLWIATLFLVCIRRRDARDSFSS